MVSAATISAAMSDAVESDARTDRRILIGVTAALGVAIAVFTTVQSVMVLGVFSPLLSGSIPVLGVELTARIGVNLAALGLLIAGVAVLRPERRGILGRIVTVGATAVVVAGVRALLQAAVGIYDSSADGVLALGSDALTCLAWLVLAQVMGLLFVAMWRLARKGERMRLVAQEGGFQLLRELQEEELRIRREIAETIHGSVQGIFVVLEAQLRRLAETSETQREELAQIAGRIGALREGELRTLSARLYPVDLARGTDAALRTLLARLPAWVTVHDEASSVLAATEDELSLEARVVVIRVVEDALSNALRHGGAQTIRVSAQTGEHGLTLDVVSDGEGPSADAAKSGLARLGRRAEVLGGSLELWADESGGATLRLVLPLPA